MERNFRNSKKQRPYFHGRLKRHMSYFVENIIVNSRIGPLGHTFDLDLDDDVTDK